jgi:hypothetical protein
MFCVTLAAPEVVERTIACGTQGLVWGLRPEFRGGHPGSGGFEPRFDGQNLGWVASGRDRMASDADRVGFTPGRMA